MIDRFELYFSTVKILAQRPTHISAVAGTTNNQDRKKEKEKKERKGKEKKKQKERKKNDPVLLRIGYPYHITNREFDCLTGLKILRLVC